MSPHWSDRYRSPENLCGNCGHPRMDHLDQPDLKGAPPDSDREWTTLPEGMCIFQPCEKGCTRFVEPSGTGRLSTSEPAIQNIPVRTELGREIRQAFISHERENYVVQADYADVETRLLEYMEAIALEDPTS